MSTEHERPSTEGKGGGKQKLRKTDVDVPLCIRRSDDQNNLAEKEKGNSKEAAVKEDYERSNKEEKRKSSIETEEEQESTFVVLQMNMRSLKSSESVEESKRDFEGCKWDALLLSETWRPNKADIWETHFARYMGAGIFENTHGVAILFNKKWRKVINWR